MVNIDVPTAVVAVIVSVLLSFFKDNATEIIQKWMDERSNKRKEAIQWYRKIQGIADEIQLFILAVDVERSKKNKFMTLSRDSLEKKLQKIDPKDYTNVGEFAEYINNAEEGVLEHLEITDIEHEDEVSTEDIIMEFREETLSSYDNEIKQEFKNELDERVESEMYQFFDRMSKHYASRPTTIDEDVFEEFTGLLSKCYIRSTFKILDKENSDELVDNAQRLIKECEKEIEQIESEYKIRNMI